MTSKWLDLRNLSSHNEEELKELLQSYLRRAEDLDNRESKVLKQVEILNSAVASLQAWSESRKHSGPSKSSVLVDVDEIEEETKKIKEETTRIQKEVRMKMEENRKLQEEIEKRRLIQQTQVTKDFDEDAFVVEYDENVVNSMKEKKAKQPTRQEIKSWSPSAPVLEQQNEDPGIQFLFEKMKKLKEIEKRQQKESLEERQLADIRNKTMRNKIEALEAQTEIGKKLVSALKGKSKKKGISPFHQNSEKCSN